ncbi:signal recognition particle-docking protein FtsY [Gudongella sp. SC589]|uniref:signal recognition particle-docking protein FtsY n=1 Tax=Gudongella sp. SC589 TaxID=3385990 RepID=UPI003904BA82
MFNWFKKDKKKQEEYNQTLESLNTDNGIDLEDEGDSCETVEDEAVSTHQIEDEDSGSVSGGILERLKNGLSKTRKDMSNKIEDIISGYKGVDDELFDDLEDVLVSADVGVNPTMMIIDRLRERVREERVSDPKEVKGLLKDEIKKLMMESVPSNELNLLPHPSVLLVVGVNGVGKTTTIGKLAYGFKENGEKVLIAAGDTFRAAAIEQLEEWSNRAGAEIISHTEGSDPAAVIFDGIQAAKARKADILICDTAGRLHNKSNLMNELNKIFRIVEREYGEATKEVLLVLDATTGQNAINQAKVFKEVANITGVALTKLDGTAKGGVAIALQTELKLPIKIIGVGEKVEDLQPFDTDSFIDAIFE